MMQICGETPKTHVQKGQKEYDGKKSVMQIVDVSLLWKLINFSCWPSLSGVCKENKKKKYI